MTTDPAQNERGPAPAGLTLYLGGTFDPIEMAKALGLRPIRMEFAGTNEVCVCTGAGGPKRFRVSRTIPCDRLKVSVPGDKAIESLFRALLSAVDALSGPLRTTWDRLSHRFADLGLYWMNEGNCGTEYDLPAPVLADLAGHGISLRISVYEGDGAVDKAIRDRAAESD